MVYPYQDVIIEGQQDIFIHYTEYDGQLDPTAKAAKYHKSTSS